MKQLILTSIACIFILQLKAQDLRTSRNTSYYTYLYKLTAQQADIIYENNAGKVDHTFYTQLLDSFPTSKNYEKPLHTGHYLYLKTIENQLKLEVFSKNNVEINILNNNRDLSIMVHDFSGNIVSDATLKIRDKSIQFDNKTNTYFVKRTNLYGLLKITHLGHTNYFNIKADHRFPKFKIDVNKALCAVPQSFIRSIKYIFQPKQHRYNGYMVFNKPKYMPGDTVYLKAHIINEKCKPVEDSLCVELYAGSSKNIGCIKPSKPGVYTFQFIATRSLGLKLDQNYRISLKNGNTYYISNNFRFEEYELKSTKYEFRADKPNYHYKDHVAFYCRGADENDLQLPDARVELTLLKENISEYYNNRVFVPDTLWIHKQNLDPLGETKIIVPDSIFPKVAVKVRAEAHFLNSNNELQTKTVFIVKDNIQKEIVFKLNKDTICIDFTINGVPQAHNAKLSVPGFVENKEITLPYRDKVNPFAYSYKVETDSLNENYTLDEEESNVQCYSGRDKDSVWFSIENPRNVPITYTIFRKNRPIFRGTGKNPTFTCRATTRKNYSVSVQYIWSAETKNNEYTIPFREKQLKINIYQPAVVYPGQKVKINVAVTDAYGKPVPGADITALSFTKKFNSNHVPTLSYLGKQYPNRSIFNNFRANENFSQLEGLKNIDWKRWNPLLSLDTIERYKFIYPKDGYYSFTFSRTDTTFAEVSPFLVDSMGNLMPVNILYIDYNPVYMSITTNPKPYVFRVDGGWHTLKIRTTDKEIELYRVLLKKGTKTILCINPYISNPKYSVKKTNPWYTPNEQNLIRNSVFAVRQNYWNSFITLNQGVNYEILNTKNYYGNSIVGPYKPGSFKYQRHGFFSVNTNLEANFEYEFLPDLVKMRCWNILNNKSYTEYKIPAQAFNDSVYTCEDIQMMWQQTLNREQSIKPAYNNPDYTMRGNGLLLIEYRPSEIKYDLQPKNIMIFSYSNPYFTRIYQGNERNIHNLTPGIYRIETLLFGNSYIVTDSIEIKPNGTNYCRYNSSDIKTRTPYLDSISSIIQRRLFYAPDEIKYLENYREEQERINELAKKNRKITYTGNHILRGKIFDAITSEPLPGVNIVIEGTTQGTISNIDGEFDIAIPSTPYTIAVSFIGYVTEKLQFKKGADIRIFLTPDIKALEEVVVVGYGTQKKSDITGSIVSVSAAQLEGTVPGVIATANQGITIRGIEAINALNNPLFVVDGNPQDGDFNALNPEEITAMEIIKDASAVAIYGARAANGVIIVTTKKKAGYSLVPNILQNKAFMEGISQSKTLRTRFSDYAFWKPDLTTNKQGVASFETTFPDDVTSWKTYYLAMGAKGASGQTEGEIKSFKPIMSGLVVPRFLLVGDHTNILGKALNYTNDSIRVKSSFRINDSTLYQKDGEILASRIDTFTLSPTTKDSVKVQYQILKNDGYSDGELRYIPVFPLGTTETKGSFYNLENDTTVALTFDKSLGNVTLHAEADLINVMLEEMGQLRNYQHFCNEQLSSKLKAMLWERKIFTLMNKEYKYDADIRKIIKLLEERRNADSLWSWWQNGQTAWWITLHATEALKMAQNDSFKTSANLKLALPHLYNQYYTMYYRDQIRAMKLLKAIDTVPNYKQLIDSIKINKYDAVGRYELWELKQSCGLKYPMDSLKQEQKNTQFGNLYWGTEGYSLFDDAISATLVAYRILRNENPKNRELFKIRNYMLERKGSMHWRNTWETCRILETILPDLIKNHELNLKPELHFSGAIKNKVDSFPFHQEIKPGEPIYVTKKSNAPVYLTTYQQFFNLAPQAVNKDFIVTSGFENNDTILKAGKPINLIVKVSVKKASEYVMIEIPIPAGCSYQDKNNFVWGEDYREYFKEKVCIYCSRLNQSKYTFTVSLLPRYNGVYHLNPAKAELMYFPVFYGREGIKTIEIR